MSAVVSIVVRENIMSDFCSFYQFTCDQRLNASFTALILVDLFQCNNMVKIEWII